ncbi:MAG: M23 family metallopeptidase [Halanaerobium sp.]|nr:M23 family metallopeptidase [Halanaerobium sp.]
MIDISVFPEHIYIEKGEYNQYLNFDFLIENNYNQEFFIKSIKLSILDENDRLIMKNSIDDSAVTPSIELIGERKLKKNDSLYIFNPFWIFSRDMHLTNLHFEFNFISGDNEQLKKELSLTPSIYQSKTKIILPLKRRMMVYDGTDIYSHHRRVDLSHEILRKIGFRANSGRFAYDLCSVNDKHRLYDNDGLKTTDWFGFGEPVYAPGSGKVIKVVNDMEDNILGEKMFDFDNLFVDPDSMMGNHVIIDHFNGEYSVLAHFKQGSIIVNAGDEVERGRQIGKMGFSGSTGRYVHIHYELRKGINLVQSEGLPLYFNRFFRIRGNNRIDVETGRLNTGEIIEPQNESDYI